MLTCQCRESFVVNWWVSAHFKALPGLTGHELITALGSRQGPLKNLWFYQRKRNGSFIKSEHPLKEFWVEHLPVYFRALKRETQREKKKSQSIFFSLSLSSFLTNIHWRALADSHPALMELYEGSVLDGLPRLSYANDFTPCSSVIGSLLLIFCQRVTSLARSYCANRQH